MKIKVFFCQIYGIMLSFARIKYYFFYFGKFMELYQNLPKIWNYMKFCQKYKLMFEFCQIYGVMPSSSKNMGLGFRV
jgi:hypothetical protein